jgi:hypothetical protein
MEKIEKKSLRDLIVNPFYLFHLIDLYKTAYDLPKSKADLLDDLISRRFEWDTNHFQPMPLADKKILIFGMLERLALGMGMLGRNYLADDEFQMIISDEGQRNNLKCGTVWKKEQQETTQWQFEHNNFQEFLAARALARFPLEIVQNIVAIEPAYQKIIPSWANTLSFVFSLPTQPDITAWLRTLPPEIIVNCELDKIPLENRTAIFKSVFKQYRDKQIWIDRDLYQYPKLAKFGESVKSVDFLLEEGNAATHYTVKINAIQLLKHMSMNSAQKTQAAKFLYNNAINLSESLVSHAALIAIADLNLYEKRQMSDLIQALRGSENDRIRSGLYYLLHNSAYLNENIDVFLEGIEYVRYKPGRSYEESRLGDENYHLQKGLEKATAPYAVCKILDYFIAHTSDAHDYTLIGVVSHLAANVAEAYADMPELFEKAKTLLSTMVKLGYEGEPQQFLAFFNKTNTRKKAFQELLPISEDRLGVLATLADETCLEMMIDKYRNNELSADDVWRFQNGLAFWNNPLFLPFNQKINDASNYQFILPAREDFQGKRENYRQNEWNLLFDLNQFLVKIEEVYKAQSKTQLTLSEIETIENIELHKFPIPTYSEHTVYTIRDLISQSANQSLSLEEIQEKLKNDWDWISICKIYDWLCKDTEKKTRLTQPQTQRINQWCQTKLSTVNFKTALIILDNGGRQTSWNALFLQFFLIRLDLNYPKSTLLDMLSFDWDWRAAGMPNGFEYLEKRLAFGEIKKRIFENMEQNITNPYSAENYLHFCKKHNLPEIVPFALKITLENNEPNSGLRYLALETFLAVSKSLNDLETMLPNIKDDFKWKVIEKIIESKEHSRSIHSYLHDILEHGDPNDQINAAANLVLLQDMQGLGYYAEWIEKNKKYSDDMFAKSPLRSLLDYTALSVLMELLNFSYKEQIQQDNFSRLDQAVLSALTNLALQSENKFIAIKAEVETFVRTYTGKYEHVNFLNSFLDGLDKQFITMKSAPADIKKVVEKLEQLKI